MKKLIVVLLILGQNLSAQDFIYLDNSNITNTLNPALTGDKCGPRLSIIGQSISFDGILSPTYRTLGFNFDMPFALSNGYSLGIGYRYVNDFSGSNLGLIGNLFSLSLQKTIVTPTLKHTVSAGIEGGIHRRTFHSENLRWPSQIGSNGFDPTLPSNEPDIDLTSIYGDVNLGLVWETAFSANTSFTIGTAFYHVNKPDISFLGTKSQIAIRSQWHASLQTKITDRIEIIPTVYYTKQGPSDVYNIGLFGSFMLSPKTNILGGLGYLKNGQPYISASVEFPKFTFGGSFGLKNDLNQTRYEAIVAYRFKECD